MKSRREKATRKLERLYRGKGGNMADDVKKFKEMFDTCMEESMSKFDFKKIPEQRKQNIIQKFKKAMSV